MCDSLIISLSSDEEDSTVVSPPKKRLRTQLLDVTITPIKKKKPLLETHLREVTITPVKKKNSGKASIKADIVVLSDDDSLDEISFKRLNNQDVQKKSRNSNEAHVCEITESDTEDSSGKENHLQKDNRDNWIQFERYSKTQNNSMKNQSTSSKVIEVCEITESDTEESSEKENHLQKGDADKNIEHNITLESQGTSNKSKISEVTGSNTKDSAKKDEFHEKSLDDKTEVEKNDVQSIDATIKNINASEELIEECEITENGTEKSPEKQTRYKSTYKEEMIASCAASELLQHFLDVCERQFKDSKYANLINTNFIVLKKCYKKCFVTLIECSRFNVLLKDNIKKAEISSGKAVRAFNEVYEFIKDTEDALSIEVDIEAKRKLKKLEKSIKLLLKRIKKLEEAEVDFDAEEDSTYIQLDRYKKRLAMVHKKYCELLKKNPYSGRLTHSRIDFVDSEIDELNKAINKRFRNQNFPSYYEMEKLIKEVVIKENLQLSEARIKIEAEQCFKNLGELLQLRRKRDLYDSHSYYIETSEDPASKDERLNSKLKENLKEGMERIGKLCEEFVKKQEMGEDPSVNGSDSDQTSYKDSEDEDENETDEDKNNKQDEKDGLEEK